MEVIKVGGEVLDRVEDLARIIDDTIVVHGGGPKVSDVMERMGLEPRFVRGLRVTDRRTLEVVIMVLAGLVNKRLVAELRSEGVNALGLSGIDGGLLIAEKRLEVVDGEEVDLGYVGDVKRVNSELLESLLNVGYVPVIAPLGVGEDGTVYNVNADTAAGAIAGAVRADRLVLLTDVPGVMGDLSDPETLIERVHPEDIEKLEEDGIVTGGMVPKLEAAKMAVEAGCREAVITNLDGLLEGKGTIVR
ncbi:acetylglutamate kinase [Methanopyrus sp.]